jgi:cell division protein ZapE
MTIKESFDAAVMAQNLVYDESQAAVVSRLDDLQRRILAEETVGARLLRLLRGRKDRPGPRGIYLWGGVGRGKTCLLDLFFDSLDCTAKRRIHFHRMMRDVHSRLNLIQDIEDPLATVAADISRETRVLCFDEFFVSDIGDAMILGRLLDKLFRLGVTLVATSNSAPADLYRDGLQRQRFVPAIEALERYTEIIELDGGMDYRLRLFEEAGTYLAPDDDTAERKLAHYFEEIASGRIIRAHRIDVLGREIETRRAAKGVAWFDFADICDGPRSQNDYIEIARWYPTVIVSGVPVLTASHDNAARRFIALVDEFYDRKVKLVLSAAAGIDALYQGERLAFEFQRTASRLVEMQSAEYLHAPHLA